MSAVTTWQRRGAKGMAALAAVLLVLASLPATASAGQHERTAEPPDPRAIGGSCPEGTVPDAGFTDVPAGSPHALAVDCAAWYGIAQGGPGARPADRYGPGLGVRRDQMASFIARFIDHSVADLPAWDGDNRFRDVGADSPHVAAINRLAAVGVVAGGPGGAPASDYGPAQRVRRDQMASFINRSLGFVLPEPLRTDEVYFDDLAGVLAEHADNINVLAEEGIAAGLPVDGQRLYAPADAVRRDQMASFLMRAMDLLIKLHMAALPEDGEPADPHTEQSYIQAPQEVVAGAPGHTFDIEVFGFDQPQDNPAPVNVALFPCDVLDTADPTDFRFRDDDGDGHADGIGTSDTGAAVITSLHGDATDTTHLDSVRPDADDRISYSIHSEAADCTTPVVFHDADNNDQLDVNDQGQPLEHWNYTERVWEAAGADTAVAVTADGRVVVLDPDTGDEVRTLMAGVPTDDPAKNDVAVTPDRSHTYVAVPAEDTADEEEIVRVPTGGGTAELVATGASSPAVSPDGGTLAYVIFAGPGPGDPDPRLVLRDVATGDEVVFSGTEVPLHFIADVEWTADGSEVVFTAGEINTAVYAVDRNATSMAEARRLGPGADPQSDVSWGSTAAFGDQLAVVERCCDVGFEDRWHIISVDPADGSIDALVPDFRLEATHLDSDAAATGLLIVEDGGLGGGDLLRWHGSGSPELVTQGVVAAAW